MDESATRASQTVGLGARTMAAAAAEAQRLRYRPIIPSACGTVISASSTKATVTAAAAAHATSRLEIATTTRADSLPAGKTFSIARNASARQHQSVAGDGHCEALT